MEVGKDTVKFLKRQIESKMVRSKNQHFFLPETYLDLIFQTDVIDKAVDELTCPFVEKIDLANTISQKGIRTFAILIKMGKKTLSRSFASTKR